MSDEKVYGWRLLLVWVGLFSISWVLAGLVAKVLWYLLLLGWRLIP